MTGNSLFANSIKDSEAKFFESSMLLIQRVLPAHAQDFKVEIIQADKEKDVFEIESSAGIIILRGNNGVSIASALNYYLKYVAKCDISWNCGNQLNLPKILPKPSSKIHISSPNKYRYVYNFCTHGYTMAWWNWEQWEKEIDFIAMQGINLALVIQGQEQLWVNTLEQFGFTEAEVYQWLVMPSHQPWQLMSNIEGFGEPVPESVVTKRLELGKKIIARMKELGIDPVLPGYYGIVPSSLKDKYPHANIHPQGLWCNMKRPDMLDSTDSLFSTIANCYYQEQNKLFGVINYFAADPFHEGGATKGIDIPKCGQIIYHSMQKNNANSIWVLQAWMSNPLQEMLDGLDKSKLLVLDLSCEKLENWRNRNSFNNTPWLWCVVSNFGGNNGLDSDLEYYTQAYANAQANLQHGKMSGIGCLAEGSQTMPVVWELFFENTWRNDSVNINQWVKQYVQRRYGVNSSLAQKAWTKLLKLNYGCFSKEQIPYNSALCARPSLKPILKAREWGTTEIPYNPIKLMEAWKTLIDASKECGNFDGYRYDLADVTRQVLADATTICHLKLLEAYQLKDKRKLAKLSYTMYKLMNGMEEITGTRKEFLFGKWIQDARNYGITNNESDLCEYNARLLLTLWSETGSESGTLRDYSNRQWNGLISDFYKPRWEMWLKAMKESLDNETEFNEVETRNAILNWELKWVKKTKPIFIAKPIENTIEVAKTIYRKMLFTLKYLYEK